MIVGDGRRAEHPVHAPVERAGGILEPRFGGGIDQGVGGAGKGEAVGFEGAVAAEQPQPQCLPRADPRDQVAAADGVFTGKGNGHDFRFRTGEAEALVQQFAPIAVDVEQAPREQGQRDHIHGKDARGQRDAPRHPEPDRQRSLCAVPVYVQPSAKE